VPARAVPVSVRGRGHPGGPAHACTRTLPASSWSVRRRPPFPSKAMQLCKQPVHAWGPLPLPHRHAQRRHCRWAFLPGAGSPTAPLLLPSWKPHARSRWACHSWPASIY